MKTSILIAFLAFLTAGVSAQNRYFTKTGKIYFDATTPSSPEKIEATNEKATSVIDAGSGAMEFAVLLKAFAFERALMQEHFNENYVESDKYPKSTFKGSVTNIKEVNLSKDGSYPVKLKGQMTLHGVTKEVEADGTLTVKGGAIVSGKSNFKILFSDFNIVIPNLVKDKVAKEATIKVDVNYEPLKAS